MKMERELLGPHRIPGAVIMTVRLLSVISACLGVSLALGLATLVATPIVPGTGIADAAQSTAPNQCVACHTDAAKLKALTPPDPPAAETGEG